jgi:hypothetical protein
MKIRIEVYEITLLNRKSVVIKRSFTVADLPSGGDVKEGRKKMPMSSIHWRAPFATPAQVTSDGHRRAATI